MAYHPSFFRTVICICFHVLSIKTYDIILIREIRFAAVLHREG